MISDWFIGINIKCDADKFAKLLELAQINCYDKKIKKVRFYYDDLTFFFFKSDLPRSELISKIKNNLTLISEIIEFSFYDKVD